MNAIILAAGIGSRLNPLTAHIPKPLVRVEGIPIIERQITMLKEKGITDISIITGHLHELFAYLVPKFGVRLIYNEHYASFNNLYSLFLAKEYFGDSYILEGDVYLSRNFLIAAPGTSTYFCGHKDKISQEWIVNYDTHVRNILIVSDEHLNDPLYKNGAKIFAGISFWTRQDAALIKSSMEMHVASSLAEKDAPQRNYFWDMMILENLPRLSIAVQSLDSNDWFEIDRYTELQALSSHLDMAAVAR
ncbi:MAG TPA: sugar phosphate nucleotidyltransferase [Chitinophaga sp.]|uniref:sugar phosphate nucleotidyltransferase n=1 Tax=Chitinophaga sp. TaxID=1869181 RepID=UPI002CE8D960|nr:sugar phosphate nucleotidyltransferase [Chitinophaga sp.]HVI45581.1 sugar phosphate nucleotidyltransferase [Chitinophaga sp.]